MALLVTDLFTELRRFMDPDFEEFVTTETELFDPLLFPTQEALITEHARRLKEDPEYKALIWSRAYSRYMRTVTVSGILSPTHDVSEALMYEFLVIYFSIPKTPATVLTDLVGFVASFPVYTHSLLFGGFNPWDAGVGPFPSTPAPILSPLPPPGLIPPPFDQIPINQAACGLMAASLHSWTLTNARIPTGGPPAVFFA